VEIRPCGEVMEWAHQQGYSVVWNDWNQERDPWSSIGSRTCEKAAKYGQLYVLQWLRENDCAWNFDTCSAAALIGHFSILQWLRENGCCDCNEMTCCNARYGHLTCLQWARENGCDWDTETCYNAALNGHLFDALGDKYALMQDWTGSSYTYLVFTLDWHYDAVIPYVNVSMPEYVPKNLKKLGHTPPL